VKRAFNYTERKKIPASAVRIAIKEDTPDGIPVFEADLIGLKRLNLEAAHRLIIEPYVVSTSMRFDFGLIGNPQAPLDLRLTDLDQGGAIRFRVFVVDEASDPRRIVAAGTVSAGEPDDANRQSILRLVETATLGERLWKLDLANEAMPELMINSAIPGFKGRLLGDPLVQGLVLPAVVRELLEEVLRGSVSDDADWASGWKQYAEKLAARSVPLEDDGIDDFIEDCVQSFCSEHRFAARQIRLMKGKDDE